MDDKRLTIERWLIKADHDLLTAKTMLHVEGTMDVVCFHAQLCAEKCLKSYLVFVDRDFPKTHDLQNLLKLCADHDPSFASMEDDARVLADYAVEVRYVDDWRTIESGEAASAIEMAMHIYDHVKRKLGVD